jgi:EpsI family protein
VRSILERGQSRGLLSHVFRMARVPGVAGNADLAAADSAFPVGFVGSTFMNGIRFGLAVMLLASTGWFLHSRNDELIPRHERLETFPLQLGDWVGTDLEIPKEVSQVLGAGDFLFRDYSKIELPNSRVNLFIAYFPSQRIGDTIHSPKNCLPGAGWSPLASSRITVAVPGEPPLEVNRYVVAKGGQRAIVLYWYWAHGRAVASEYRAKYYLVEDSVRLNRSDGSLIRVVRQLREHENATTAQQQMVSLIDQAIPRLDPYIPR